MEMLKAMELMLLTRPRSGDGTSSWNKVLIGITVTVTPKPKIRLPKQAGQSTGDNAMTHMPRP
ncbi:hypothetical protein D3C86_2159760 [compost metagenome]